MSEPIIKELETLIKEFKRHNLSIADKKLSYLTAPGDNYCSTMVRIEATIRNEESGDEEILHAVAKSADVYQNDSNEMLKSFVPILFKNEYAFYTEILPAMRKFQKDHGVDDVLDFFPKLLAARLNVSGADKADPDAVIMLENLVESGYSTADRQIGFDLECTKLILKDLAIFHALPLAMKLKNPELFQEKIKENCKPLEMPPPPEGPPPPPSYPVWLEILQEFDSCAPYVSKYSDNLKEMSGNMDKIFNKAGTEPFATLVHCDLWVNNTMQKYSEGKLVGNKLLDFQVGTYASPAHDIVFFLNTSVQTVVLRRHFDDLLEHYHGNFIKILKSFKCDTAPFSYENFIEEIKKYASEEAAGRTPVMMLPIFGEKGSAVDIPKLMGTGMKREDIPQAAIDRMRCIVENLGKRGWL